MHGTLRFVLAMLVALSHIGVLLPNFNQGVFAVVIFYILAGMVSYKLISNNFYNQPVLYYKNRIKRIFPFYLSVLSISVIVYFLGAKSSFLASSPSLFDWLSNLFVIPIAYYKYLQVDTFLLIPPAWSLGVELQFYLLAPFILKSKKLFISMFIGSFFIYALASIGILNTDQFGYRLIVGVLFIFLLGVLIQKTRERKFFFSVNLVMIYLVIMMIALYCYIAEYKALYNYETLLALLVGIPFLLYFNSPVPIKIDKYLGSISYGVFLLHFPSLWILQTLVQTKPSVYLILLLTIVLSIIIQQLLQFFDSRTN